MSTYWSLFCLDCNVNDNSTDINHGEVALAEAIDAYPIVKTLWDKGYMWIEGPTLMNKGSGVFSFIREHENHRVVPLSEYGEVYRGDDEYERA